MAPEVGPSGVGAVLAPSVDKGATEGVAAAKGVAVVAFTSVTLLGAMLGLFVALLIGEIGAIVRFNVGAIGCMVAVSFKSMMEVQDRTESAVLQIRRNHDV